jgi:hypothetical protein
MSKRLATLVLFSILTSSAMGQSAVQWRVQDGGNGHWYRAIANGSPICWDLARIASNNMGGHLATLTSAAEDQWVCTHVVQTTPNLYPPGCGWDGPMIGASKQSDYNWQWVTGEPFEYQHFVWSNGNGPEMVQFFQGGCGWDGTGVCGGACGGNVSYIVEWSADCNGDGIVDYGQIRSGQLTDNDQSGVPDVCECGSDPDGDGVGNNCEECPDDPNKLLPGTCGCGSAGRDLDGDGLEDCCLDGKPACCVGDVDGNGRVAAEDLAAILFAWGPVTGATQPLDLDGDGEIRGTDLAIVVAGWGDCP